MKRQEIGRDLTCTCMSVMHIDRDVETHLFVNFSIVNAGHLNAAYSFILKSVMLDYNLKLFLCFSGIKFSKEHFSSHIYLLVSFMQRLRFLICIIRKATPDSRLRST